MKVRLWMLLSERVHVDDELHKLSIRVFAQLRTGVSHLLRFADRLTILIDAIRHDAA